jgi:FkbM family methyltransferase
MLPYTRAELPGWGRLLKYIDGPHIYKALQYRDGKAMHVTVRGKNHGFLMKLDMSDWAQRMTFFLGRYYELGVSRTLEVLLRPGDRFVDVGSNIGMVTLHARYLVGANGHIDCFEPNPDNVVAIREHMRINHIENVLIHQCALADTAGSMTLNLTSDHTGTATLADVGADAVRTMEVTIRIGDEIIVGPPRLIKIDVEGFELHVLKGLKRTLSLHKPFVITELIEDQLNRANTSVFEVSDYLFELGYKAFGIGTRRKALRHELSLYPVEREHSLRDFADVLWAHGENVPEELTRHFGPSIR